MKKDNFDDVVNAMVNAYNNADDKENKEDSFNDFTTTTMDEINTKLERISNDVHYISSLCKTFVIATIIGFVVILIANMIA